MSEKTALLSVFHKDGIIEFAQRLLKLRYKLLASGGTCRHLREAGLEVTDVADMVGFPPILDHGVVTLSHKIHAGLLAKHTDEHQADMETVGAEYIDLVCVDLYPLEQAIADPDVDLAKLLNNFYDVGGPTMLSSGSKRQRIVICDPIDRGFVLDRLESDGELTMLDIEMLASKADKVVAAYRLLSARYRSNGHFEGFIGERTATIPKGENGHQSPASLYSCGIDDPLGLDKFKLIAGMAPSYNNWCDVDRLLQTITHIAAGFHVNFGEVPLCGVAVKHGNGCGASTESSEVVGASVGDEPCEILKRIVTGDTRAIFGGLVMVNFGIGVEEAEILLSHAVEKGRRLLDGIIAPFFSDEALEMLKRKKDKCRFLANEALGSLSPDSLDSALRFRYVRGGFLTQPNYTYVFNFKHEALEVFGPLSHPQKYNLLLGWAINATSNSNTITLVRDNMLIGNGCGQQDRVSAANLAITKAKDAGHETKDAVAISDSFFPFEDGPQVLCEAGVNAILTTNGSVRDKHVKRTIESANATLLWVPDGVGRGFFGH